MTNPISTGSTVALDRLYRRVLVPFDGSECGTIALRSGSALASLLQATLHTVSSAGDSGELTRLRRGAADALDVAPTDPRVHAIWGDDPSGGIAAVAEELGEGTPS